VAKDLENPFAAEMNSTLVSPTLSSMVAAQADMSSVLVSSGQASPLADEGTAGSYARVLPRIDATTLYTTSGPNWDFDPSSNGTWD